MSHLASQYAIIFSQEYAYQLNADNNLAQLDTHPVGTGPYQVQNYVYNQYVRLLRNDNYWNKDAKIKHILVDLSTERTTRLIKFFNNECQIASYPEVSQLGLLHNNDERYYLQSTDGMNLSYLAFNFNKPLMQNEQIRQAISQSINRARIVRNIYHNTATVANNIIPNISWASTVNTPEFEFDYSPKQAKNILSGKNLHLNMWVLNEEQVYNPSPLKTAELIKWDLAQAGVKVKVRSVTRVFLLDQLAKKTEDYDIILTGWLAGNLDPDGFMRPILSCDTKDDITNLSNWCNPKFNQLMDNALSSTRLQERARNYNLAQDLVLRELPIVPIASAKRFLVANRKVKGVKMSPFGSMHFRHSILRRRKIMLWSALRHLLWASLLLFILTLLSFAILMRDPLNSALITNSIYSAYFHYLSALLQGDFGITYNGGQSLKSLIFTVLPPTLELCFSALLLAFILSIPLGILSAVNNQGIFQRAYKTSLMWDYLSPFFGSHRFYFIRQQFTVGKSPQQDNIICSMKLNRLPAFR
ncbi:peptide transport periplasmic protein SapA [Rodentibacter pneumotropicus]|uniref:Peptide transport periplasmic protein SapA n=1 Tax=Rodentibacter pneumotropicus TaxID=758 RepID=A0A3S4Y2K4_9PAST|nr:peptide transport periplasmic protein SapA [Rodentibacter pneumotropicus]